MIDELMGNVDAPYIKWASERDEGQGFCKVSEQGSSFKDELVKELRLL